MSFTALVLLDQILEESISKLELNRQEEIQITIYEEGIKLSQVGVTVDGRIKLNSRPETDPLDTKELQRLFEIIVSNKNAKGLKLKIN